MHDKFSSLFKCHHHFHVQLPPTAPACHAGRPEVIRCRHLLALGSCKPSHVRRRLACEPAQLKGTIWSINPYGQQGACAAWGNSNCVMAPRCDSRQSVNVQQTAPVTFSHPRASALNFCCWYICMALADVHSTANWWCEMGWVLPWLSADFSCSLQRLMIPRIHPPTHVLTCSCIPVSCHDLSP